LIRKAYNALTRTLQNNGSEFMESEDMILVDNDVENEEDGDEKSDGIESKLIERPLSCVNYDPSDEQPIVECIAVKLVRTRQLHSIILDFFYNQCFKKIILYKDR